MVVRTGSVLVVDDDALNRKLLMRSLENEGHAVRSAADGSEALRLLGHEPSDVVLLDILMPALDGFEVLQRMKDDVLLRHIPVIMISAVEDIESIVRCIEMGAEDYLPKPFDPVILRARVNAGLSRKQLHDLVFSARYPTSDLSA
jgi:DNA-binding response OmpR family regulator